MRYFQPIATGVDVLPLAHALQRQPELWDQNTLRTTHPMTPHKSVNDVWLRFNDLAEYERTGDPSTIIDQHESIWYPAAKALPQCRPIIFDLARRVEAERIGRCIITRLAPGKQIDPHVDSGDHAAYYSRFHVILQNLPGSVFHCGGESVTMRSGDVWWFDNSTQHSVVNNSADDRITLIVDLRQS